MQEIVRRRGVISINDPKSTRFWLQMKDANQFVINVIESMDNYSGGEIFVPRMPSVNIMTLWHAMTDGLLTFNVNGSRVGDKLHETLILPEEIRHTVGTDWGYVIYPEAPHWRYTPILGYPPGYQEGYRSDNNSHQLNVDEIKETLNV